MNLDSPVFTIKDLADYLRICPSTVYRLLKGHKLPHFKIGSDHRFLKSEIDKWMKDATAR